MMKKSLRIEESTIEMRGIPHFPTSHDKNLEEEIGKADIVAIEGSAFFPNVNEETIQFFLGKEGREKLKEFNTPITSLDPNYHDPISDINFSPFSFLLFGASSYFSFTKISLMKNFLLE